MDACPCPCPDDAEAFEAFEDRLVALRPRLFQIAMRLCRNKADAHDLVHDAIERGLRCRALFRAGEALDRWMATILRRIFVDGYRSQRSRARLMSSIQPETESPAEPPCLPPWEVFSIEDVRRALLFLDPSYREVFTLFTFDSLPQREISRRLSISSSTVATRILRGRRKLRQLLESGEHQRPLALVPPAVAGRGFAVTPPPIVPLLPLLPLAAPAIGPLVGGEHRPADAPRPSMVRVRVARGRDRVSSTDLQAVAI